MSICIQYSRPSAGKDETEIFGLDVAVSNFLSAYFRYSQQKEFVCRPTDHKSFEHFKSLAGKAGLDAEKQCLGIDPRHPEKNLGSFGAIFRPDPLIVDLIWRRQQLGNKGFAACGLVHTMSGERIARAVGELCLCPSEVTDALICPSDAIRDAVRSLWEIHSEYLNYHFNTRYECPVQTPVIPLGIDTEKFRLLTTEDKRKSQRETLKAADDEVILLFLGRLSFATKFHPLALWQAAELAAQKTSKKIRIVMYGYFKPLDMEQHFRALASDISKKVKIEFILNSDPRFPDGLWAGADIFTSLSENIQESFGLTPIEAMACSLPSIITDWNGYRGSIRDGLDGFLIKTLIPPTRAGMGIAEAYYNEENYGVSLVGSSQSTSLDIDACGSAILLLTEDKERRLAFGKSARLRAENVFDWKHIIKSYEALWQDLSDKRKNIPPKPGVPKNWQAVHPAYPNPWQMFRSFPSAILQQHDRIQIIMDKEAIEAIMKHEMNFFLPDLLTPKETMLDLVDIIRRAGKPQIEEITSAFPIAGQDRVLRCVGWMLKCGVAIQVS